VRDAPILLDDGRKVSTQTFRREEHIEVSPRISEGLEKLIPLPGAVTHALEVSPDALHSDGPFLVIQESRVEDIVGHEPETEDAGNSCDETQNQEENFPRGNGSVGNARQTIPNSRHDNERDAVAGEPVPNTATLLILLVPHGGDDDKGRGHCSFKNTEEEANGEEATIAGYNGMKRQDNAPECDINGCVLGNG
jgi:hypothetical protein